MDCQMAYGQGIQSLRCWQRCRKNTLTEPQLCHKIQNKPLQAIETEIDKMASCDTCVYNVYDEDDECYYCEVDMDEDDAVRLMQGHYKECPYYQNNDEYLVVRHQM